MVKDLIFYTYPNPKFLECSKFSYQKNSLQFEITSHFDTGG